METDLDLTQFKQLQHDYIGYQSLTDVPKAIAYSESVKDYSVRNHIKDTTLEFLIETKTSVINKQ